MTVIEFAHIRLLSGTSASDTSLRDNMKKVKQVIEDYNHLPTNFLVEEEDPYVMYVIGSWKSMKQHFEGFSGSPGQKEILGLVQNQMTIDWQHYVDIEYSRIPMDAPVLSIAKYILMRSGEMETNQWTQRKENFRRVFAEPSQEFLNAVVTAPGLKGSVGGWNIAKEGEEFLLWVQISGWDKEEDAKSFYASRQCRELMEAVEMLGVEADVRHGTMYNLG